MDHETFDEMVLDKATQAILKTRDGLLRAAVPNPLGSCSFLNDVTREEMADALRRHKNPMKEYPRKGAGIEAYVDASDTGYSINQVPVESHKNETRSPETAEVSKRNIIPNGVVSGLKGLTVNRHSGLPALQEQR